jgi:hypothetical protein
MNAIFLFFGLFFCGNVFSQDTLLARYADSIVVRIDNEEYPIVYGDTLPVYELDDNVRAHYEWDNFYFDSSGHLKKIISHRHFKKSTFYYDNHLLIKAVVEMWGESLTYLARQYWEGGTWKRDRYSVTVNFYYSSDDNQDDKVLSRYAGVDNRINFLSYLTFGRELMKRGYQKANN